MKKQNRPGPAKSAAPEEMDDTAIDKLVALALDLKEADVYASLPDDLKKKQHDLQKIIRKCLHQNREGVLTEALESTLDEDVDAFAVLKERLEESSETVVFHRDDGPDLEVDAFVIPMFVHTVGGLRIEQNFQDEAAFESLRKSFQDGELESRKANVVLVSHAYHPDEIERIGYAQLSEMVREAFETMTRKKAVATPSIARSMSGWPESTFAPDDNAMELRFLLGFSLKAKDDPFYKVPEKEAAADRYFEARAERFRRWSQQAAPLVKRCLVSDGRDAGIDFLYQDLFHGGKATGIAEYAMLKMMAELRQALQEHGLAAEASEAVVGAADIDDEMVLRVQLRAKADDAPVASFDKPMAVARDLRDEVDDVCDALATIGVQSLAVAMKFDADGNPVNARPYKLR